jgi:hypothetical protein
MDILDARPMGRADQPAQRLAVDLIGPAEVVDHLGLRGSGLRVAFVVRQGEVADHRPVRVAPVGLPQVHDYKSSSIILYRKYRHAYSCVYTFRRY